MIPPHDFNALASGVPERFQRAEPNAQAIGFLTNNLLAIQAVPDHILYTEHRLPMLVPLNMSIPEGATEYSVRVIDYTGEGDYVDNDGSSVPNASASQRLVPHGLDYAGIDASWTIEDIRNAMFSGFPLDTESLEAAVRGAQNHMERVGLVGHAGRSYLGLSSLPVTGTGAVTLITRAANMTFDDITPEAIRDVINDTISRVIEDTDEVFSTQIMDGLCVYLPVQQYNRLSSRFVGDDEERSVMRAIMEDNPWTNRTKNPVTFKSMIELKDAGAGTTDRMIVTVKDMRVFEMGVPIMPRILRILDKGREICAQVEYKFGSLFVKRPSVIYYVDGI